MFSDSGAFSTECKPKPWGVEAALASATAQGFDLRQLRYTVQGRASKEVP